MQRQESERSTGHPVRSILALTMPAVLDLAENSHPADATTRVANEAVQIYTARLSVSSQPTIRSTTFSISVAITSLPPNTEVPGCKHSGCGRKLAAALPLRYKSPTLLAQPRESSRPRPNKLPVPDRLLLHPIIVHPIINEDAGRDFRHRQRRCFRRDSTDTQMRCSSTAGNPHRPQTEHNRIKHGLPRRLRRPQKAKRLLDRSASVRVDLQPHRDLDDDGCLPLHCCIPRSDSCRWQKSGCREEAADPTDMMIDLMGRGFAPRCCGFVIYC